MKKFKLGLAAMTVFAAFTFNSCKQETPVVEEVVVVESLSGDFAVNTELSSITWLGKKVTGEHTGTIALAEGKFSIVENRISSGVINVDMKSIVVTDIEDEEMNAKLTGHLNSPDFFNTDSFATATMNVIEADEASMSVELTIKGIANTLKFPYTITETETEVLVEGTLVIDRTLYDIKYGSGKFTENLGDKMIYDDFELTFRIVANK